MDVVTFGESMILFNPDTRGPLRYIHTFHKSIAGAESNVAIAMARLGHKVGWFSKVGDDEFGRYIMSTIRGEGVDVSRTATDPNHVTGLIFKERFAHVNPNVYYYRRGSAASTLSIEDLDEDYIKNTNILHITGITLALSKATREATLRAIDVAKEAGVLISFDPNIRLKLWSIEEARPVLLEVAKKSDIIFPGLDEGEMLLGISEPEALAQAFLDMGCSKVAVKLGKEGCYVTDGVENIYVSGYSVNKMEDSVGAGDGFAAGFLAGVSRDLPLKEAAQWANGVGAMAVLVHGDMEGFPTLTQLQEFIGTKKYIDR
ncbi:MAG: sugar kinase [Epulopiscium sp.]|nr:sugar kinase [Candidatus Epulonipiscium sp.]